MTRDQAKVLNYGRIYGAGEPFARTLLAQFNASLSEEEVVKRAKHMYSQTKGSRGYKLNSRGRWLSELLGDQVAQVTSRAELWQLGKLKVIMDRLVGETRETPEGVRHTLTEEGRQLYLELLQHLEEEEEDVLGDRQLGQLLRHLVSQLHIAHWTISLPLKVPNNTLTVKVKEYSGVVAKTEAGYDDRQSLVHQVLLGADGSSRKAIRDGGLWKFLTIRQIYLLGNQS